LALLNHPNYIFPSVRLPDGVGAMAHDHCDDAGLKAPGSVQSMKKERLAAERVQDLRQRRFHPGPLPGSQENDSQFRHRESKKRKVRL
jgi:hypothetical protein